VEKWLAAKIICVKFSMNKTRQIINDNKEKFSEFGYYHNVIDKIEENIEKMPDISIESCKALVEGLSKTILKKMGEVYIEKGRNADSPNNLLKKTLNILSKYSNIDMVFAQTACGLLLRISEVRNERGDISHGKASPKEFVSDQDLAESVMHMTDGIVFYILKVYFKVGLSFVDEIKYEDNDEFNQFLDGENVLDGVSYSKALFDQDMVFYKDLLSSYLSDKEQENI
jgi:hypothetical protein